MPCLSFKTLHSKLSFEFSQLPFSFLNSIHFWNPYYHFSTNRFHSAIHHRQLSHILKGHTHPTPENDPKFTPRRGDCRLYFYVDSSGYFFVSCLILEEFSHSLLLILRKCSIYSSFYASAGSKWEYVKRLDV